MKVSSVHFNTQSKKFHFGPLKEKYLENSIYLGIHSYNDVGDLIKEVIKLLPYMDVDTALIKESYAEYFI